MEARPIGAEEMARYDDLGYMAYGSILAPKELADLRSYFGGLLANLPEGKRPEAMDLIHIGDDYLLRLCSHPRILDVIDQFIGPNIVLFSSHFICKPKGDGKAVPWHQDSTYWPLKPMRVMTLWLAVDESTVENGCMRVIPGSHKLGPLSHEDVADLNENVLHKQTRQDLYDVNKAVDIELKPGECSFHEPHLVHGSNRNHSEKRRCGYTMRFMPADTKLERSPGFWANHPLYLLRGEDARGINTYVRWREDDGI